MGVIDEYIPISPPPFHEVLLAEMPIYEYTREYISLLRMAGVNVAGVISNNKFPGFKLPVIPIGEYAGSPELHDIPVIPLGLATDERSEFSIFVDALAQALDPAIPALPLVYHWACVGALFRNVCSDHWAITGYPGSGNMLLLYTLRHIQEPDDVIAAQDELRKLVFQTGRMQNTVSIQYTLRILSPLRVTELHNAQYNVPGTQSMWGRLADGGYFILANLPNAVFIERHYTGHDVCKGCSNTATCSPWCGTRICWPIPLAKSAVSRLSWMWTCPKTARAKSGTPLASKISTPRSRGTSSGPVKASFTTTRAR